MFQFWFSVGAVLVRMFCKPRYSTIQYDTAMFVPRESPIYPNSPWKPRRRPCHIALSYRVVLPCLTMSYLLIWFLLTDQSLIRPKDRQSFLSRVSSPGALGNMLDRSWKALSSLLSSLVVFGELRLVLKSKHQAEVLPEPENRPRPIYVQTITNGSAPVKNQTNAGHVTGKQSDISDISRLLRPPCVACVSFVSALCQLCVTCAMLCNVI